VSFFPFFGEAGFFGDAAFFPFFGVDFFLAGDLDFLDGDLEADLAGDLDGDLDFLDGDLLFLEGDLDAPFLDGDLDLERDLLSSFLAVVFSISLNCSERETPDLVLTVDLLWLLRFSMALSSRLGLDG